MVNYDQCTDRIDIKDGSGPGIDLNRNFNFAFKSNDPNETDECSESYQGAAPFSEKETQAIN